MEPIELDIEWKHLDKSGDTCSRCASTGDMVRAAVADIGDDCCGVPLNVKVRETLLGPEEITHSNEILINGKLLEDILEGASVSESACGSCSDLIGAEASCRTFRFENETHETVPTDLIRAAICKVIGGN